MHSIRVSKLYPWYNYSYSCIDYALKVLTFSGTNDGGIVGMVTLLVCQLIQNAMCRMNSAYTLWLEDTLTENEISVVYLHFSA